MAFLSSLNASKNTEQNIYYNIYFNRMGCSEQIKHFLLQEQQGIMLRATVLVDWKPVQLSIQYLSVLLKNWKETTKAK